MERLPLTDPNTAAGALRSMMDRYQRQRGSVPNMLRAMGHRPEIAETAFRHMDAVYGTGTVPRTLKEMITVRVSQMNRCRY